MKAEEAFKEMRKGKKRKFVQSVDLIINLKDIDLKNPQNRFTLEVELPKGRGKDVKICAIGNKLAEALKGKVDAVITEDDLDNFEEKKREIKKIIKKCDFFVAEPQLMAKVGKVLGRYLGPKGKMPKPIPPQANMDALIKKLKNSVRIVLKEQPLIQCAIGTEDMDDKDLKENFDAVMHAILHKLPNGKNNIKSVYVKTTMGTPVRIDEF